MSQTSRRETDFGAPFDDDYRGFDMRDEETARGPLILALAVGVLMVFGAVIWNTYRQGVRAEAGQVPVITADASPYKRAPDERGGLKAANLDARVYDQMDGSERDDPPEPTRVSAPRDAEADARDLRLEGGPPIELRPGLNEADKAADPETGMPDAVADQVEALRDLNAPDRGGEQLAALTPTLPQSAPATEPEPPVAALKPASASRFDFDPSGAFLVQIAALRTEEAAEEAWDRAAASSPDLFGGAHKRIQRADLGAKGVFYRLRAGAFASRADASEFCRAVKADGGQCIVVAQ